MASRLTHSGKTFLFPIAMLILQVVSSMEAPLSLDFTTLYAPVDLETRNSRAVDLPMYNGITHQKLYLVNVQIGTPPQPFSILLDTGSSDVWLPSPDSSGCPSTGCPFNTFDSAASSTYIPTNNTFNASYGLTPDLMVIGPYFNDTLRFANAVIPDMTLAVGNIPSTLYTAGFQGIMGLGARLGEAIISHQGTPQFHDPNATFPTVYDQLQLLGYISRRAFSIYMNTPTAASGTVLFGAVDNSKYTGSLTPVPVQQLGGFTAWAVVLTSVSANINNTSISLTASNFSSTVILDTGAPSMYLPTALYTSLTAHMNATMHANTPYVPCTLLSDTSSSFTFRFGATGPRITVPQYWLIFPFEYPAAGNPANVTTEDGTRLCYLGVIPTEGPIILLGDTFIRSAYLVFDADNEVVGMAQAKFGVESECIVTLRAGSGFP
jgi:hypothetical protein